VARLELRILGGFTARVSGRPLRLPGRKAKALLAYLALRPGRTEARPRLAAILWAEADEARARDSLRHTLEILRTSLGRFHRSALLDERQALALRPGAVAVDAVTFQRLADEGTPAALARASRLCAGDLLEGLEVDEPPFDEWLAAERARLRDLALEALGRLLVHHVRDEAVDQAIRTATRLLRLDPVDETAHRALMRLYAAQGRRSAALRQYQVCASTLAREMGAEPEPETRALYHDVLGAPGPRIIPAVGTEPCGKPTPLAGRAAEAARLFGALKAVMGGRGQVAAVLGDAGVGKTRLVEDLAREAQRQGVRVLFGRCHESEHVLPFAPWVDVLRAGGLGAVPARIEGLGRAWRAELARLLPEIEPGSTTARAEVGHLRLFDAVARVVTLLAADGPLVIVLEDLHWADDLSARLLAFLGRRVGGHPVLLLATAREPDLAKHSVVACVLDEIRREPGTLLLALPPLGRAETMALVRLLAPPATPPARLSALGERIWRISEGNPFVVTEAMRALEAGEMPDEPAPLTVPARVEALVTRRLGRLTEHGRAVVAVAAIAGQGFECPLLRDASGLGEAEVAEAVEELLRAQILRTLDEGFGFTHEWVRQVVVGQVSRPKRALLHRQVAASLEATDPERHLGALAEHYRESATWAKAVEYLGRFAEQAARRYAVEDAVASLREAMALADRLAAPDRDRRRIELAVRLAHCLPRGGVPTPGPAPASEHDGYRRPGGDPRPRVPLRRRPGAANARPPRAGRRGRRDRAHSAPRRPRHVRGDRGTIRGGTHAAGPRRDPSGAG
jgi:DNA-binding SARP family transcriptional activator